MIRLKRLFCVLVWLAAALVAFAGGAKEAEEVGPSVIQSQEFIQPRRMIFFFEADPQYYSAADALYLYHSVLIAVADANPNVVILESPSPGVPVSFEDKHDRAREIQADSWLLVSATMENDEFVFNVETFDILSQTQYGGERISLGGFLDYRSLSRGAWDPLVEAISSSYEALLDQLKVTIRALPDTEIGGRGMPDLTVGATGETEIMLANPAIYSYEALADGYYPVRDIFYLGYRPLEVDIKQTPTETMAVDLKLNNFQFLGLNYYYYLVPAEWYLKAGFTTYAFGFYFLENSLNLVSGSPLTLIRLGGGKYWGDTADSVRYYTGLNLLGQFAHDFSADPKVIGFDDNAPVALEVALGTEFIFPDKHWRIFAEYDPVGYYTVDSDVFYARNFLQRYVENGQVFGFLSAGNNVVLNYLKLSTGVKFSW